MTSTLLSVIALLFLATVVPAVELEGVEDNDIINVCTSCAYSM